MSASKVVKIDFFTVETLPSGLKKTADEKGLKFGKGIIAVRTRISSPPSYDFIEVGTTPKDVQQFMSDLAKDDGADLGNAVKHAFEG